MRATGHTAWLSEETQLGGAAPGRGDTPGDRKSWQVRDPAWCSQAAFRHGSGCHHLGRCQALGGDCPELAALPRALGITSAAW